VADPEERVHHQPGVHGPVYRVPGHGQPAEFDQRPRGPGHRVPVRHIRGASAQLHIRAHVPHQAADRQVDAVSVHAVLHTVYRCPVLSAVLHAGAGRRARGPGRRAHVGRQGHVPHADRSRVRQAHRPTGGRYRRPVLRVLLLGLADRRALGQPHLFVGYVPIYDIKL